MSATVGIICRQIGQSGVKNSIIRGLSLGCPMTGTGATAPDEFGPLDPAVATDTRIAAAHVYDDTNAIPGTHTDAELTAARGDLKLDRRWTVWDYQPGNVASTGVGNGAAAKLIAVSVRYEFYRSGRTGAGTGEVVLYMQRGDPGLFLGNVAAYR